MANLAWTFFFALAAILDAASCTETPEVTKSETFPKSPNAPLSLEFQKRASPQLTGSGKIPLAAAASIITLAFLILFNWRKPVLEGAAGAAEADDDIEQFGGRKARSLHERAAGDVDAVDDIEGSGSWKAHPLQEDPAEGAGDSKDGRGLKAKLLRVGGAKGAEPVGVLDELRAWRREALKLLRALNPNHPKAVNDMEVVVQEGIPLVVEALARAEAPDGPVATKEQLKKEAQDAKVALENASKKLTGNWITRAGQAKTKMEDAMQNLREAQQDLLPGALVEAKDELLLLVERLKRVTEAAFIVHKCLKEFSEDPMPVTELYKKVQELEYVLQDANIIRLSTLKGFRTEWEGKAQALKDIIAEGGPNAENARNQLKLLGKSMVPALRRIQKLSESTPGADPTGSDGLQPK